MNDQNNIQDELKSLNSSLPVNNNPSPFSVPEGYFEGLAAEVLSKVKAQDASAAEELQALSPLLAGFPKKLPYSIPDGYFDETAAVLSSFTKEDEESPLLDAIGKNMPYTIPRGYFEQLPSQIMTTVSRPKAKLVPFLPRTWAKLAVAAAIGGIVFFGGYRLFNNSPEIPEPLATTKPATETSNSQVAQNKAGLTPDIKDISKEEVEAFVKTLPLNPAKVQPASFRPADKQEMAKWLKDVPQAEIDAFLEALPTADENLTVID
jgi:hypothetical protein